MQKRACILRVHWSLISELYCTLEQVNTSVVGKKEESYQQNFESEANWSEVVNLYCMQINRMMSMQFIFGKNPDPISDQKMLFSTPVFTPDL